MSELEPLAPDLRALLADEREAYSDDAAARARVMRRIEAAVGFAAVGVAAGAAVAAKTGFLASLGVHAAKHVKLWIALAFAGGIVLGETHARLTSPSPSPPVQAPARADAVEPRMPAPTAPTAPASAAVANEPAAIPVASLPNLATARPAAGATSAAAPSDLAAEQALIDTARSALSRGRPTDALRAADDHARQFPRGRLAEERETMAIQALLLAGRRTDAEARGRRFHTAYPGSLYGNAVDALLAPKEDAGR